MNKIPPPWISSLLQELWFRACRYKESENLAKLQWLPEGNVPACWRIHCKFQELSMLLRLGESAPAHAAGADNAASEHAVLRQSRCGCRASEVMHGPPWSGVWHWQQWLNHCSHSEVKDWHRSSPAAQQHRMETLEPVILLFLQERLWGLFVVVRCFSCFSLKYGGLFLSFFCL